MQKYNSYKATGVSWLPTMPSHWNLSHLRKYLSLVSIKDKADKMLLSVTREQGVIVRNAEDQEENHNFIPEDLSGYKYVQVGQFVINKMKSWQGSYGVSSYEGIVSPAYFVCDLKCENKEFFSKAIRSRAYVDFFAQWSKGIRVGQWDLEPNALKTIPFFEPPKNEQERIVAYLNKKIPTIDSFIAAKQRQVELLEEYKQAIIAQAVTRGLTPDVIMKPTGYFWLPEIPENWKIKRMKYLFTERSEKNHPDEQMLSATQTYGVIPQSQYGNRVVVVNTGFEGLKLVKVGDFVIHLRSFQGGIEISHAQGIISSAYTILRPIISDDGDYSPYLRFLFKSQNFIDLLKICVTGIREGQNINYAKLKQYFLPIPPIEEQKRIVKYIDIKTSEIDTLISSIAKEISLLQEYKQRLISDVVTGQINVQNETV